MPHYEAAPPVEKLAAKVLREHHPHLVDARICYLFVDPPPKKDGREVSGRCSKVPAKVNGILEAAGVQAPETGAYDFLVEIAEAHWTAADADLKEALVDHELQHAWWKWDVVMVEREDPDTGEVVEEAEKVFKSWTTRSHDVECFRAVIERRGLWHAELEELAGAIDQMRQAFAAHRKAKPEAKSGSKLKLVAKG